MYRTELSAQDGQAWKKRKCNSVYGVKYFNLNTVKLCHLSQYITTIYDKHSKLSIDLIYMTEVNRWQNMAFCFTFKSYTYVINSVTAA